MAARKMNRWEPETGRVLLTEGRFDKRFFQELIEIRGLNEFDMPWPWIERDPFLPPPRNFAGGDSFYSMLAALDAYFYKGAKEIKGILIVADARDDPVATFGNVCGQIEKARNRQTGDKFPVPRQPMTMMSGTGIMPSIEIVLMPLSGTGALETLCVNYLRQCRPGIYPDAYCNAHTYLTTAPTDVSVWSSERRSKAYLQCLLAGTHENNPAMHAQQSFSGTAPIIDLKDTFFDPVCNQITHFCDGLA